MQGLWIFLILKEVWVKDRKLLWLTHASTNGVLWDKWLYEDDKVYGRPCLLQLHDMPAIVPSV